MTSSRGRSAPPPGRSGSVDGTDDARTRGRGSCAPACRRGRGTRISAQPLRNAVVAGRGGPRKSSRRVGAAEEPRVRAGAIAIGRRGVSAVDRGGSGAQPQIVVRPVAVVGRVDQPGIDVVYPFGGPRTRPRAERPGHIRVDDAVIGDEGRRRLHAERIAVVPCDDRRGDEDVRAERVHDRSVARRPGEHRGDLPQIGR